DAIGSDAPAFFESIQLREKFGRWTDDGAGGEIGGDASDAALANPELGQLPLAGFVLLHQSADVVYASVRAADIHPALDDRFAGSEPAAQPVRGFVRRQEE